eukprot:TRINITY_DN479_c0_g4_i2.p1 TRINITY_DN479_c0_g4~~TRINITY_DN479_c0_g4_i2.p1  ORF type:complete len:104 (+),score=17.98 TRINITY_DN479_c0_g4_i2:117-428(+)
MTIIIMIMMMISKIKFATKFKIDRERKKERKRTRKKTKGVIFVVVGESERLPRGIDASSTSRRASTGVIGFLSLSSGRLAKVLLSLVPEDVESNHKRCETERS